jgi:hypothetical protein
LSAASDALDPLSGLRVKSQSQRRSHIANTHEFTVLRRVIQENCGYATGGEIMLQVSEGSRHLRGALAEFP